MTALTIYRLIHFVGIFATIVSVGGVLVHVMNGGDKESNKVRKLLAMTHGFGLLLALVGGFGMLARLGIHSFPGWVYGKLAIWLVLGALLPMGYRLQNTGSKLWWTTLALLAVAAWLAIAKPF